MSYVDVIILLLYFTIVASVGLYVGRNKNKASFLVNQGQSTFWLVLFSIVSTNVGAATCLGIAATSFKSGISYGINIAILVTFGFIFLGITAPLIKKIADDYQLTTMSSIFRVHYGSRRCQLLAASIICIAYFFFIAAQFSGAAYILSVWSGLPIELCLLFGGITLIIYTAYSGVRGDLYTDFIHFIVMFSLIIVLLPLVLFLRNISFSQLASLPREYYNPFAFSGEIFFFGSIVFGLPLMFSSMEIWQRLYSYYDPSTNKSASQRLFISAALLNAPFIIAPILLGLSAKILLPALKQDDSVLLHLIVNFMPTGLKGLAISAIIAALLSTVNSMIMVVSATVASDIFSDNVSSKMNLNMLRTITAVVGFLGLIVAYFVHGIIDLIIGGSQVISVLALPILGGLYLSKPKEREPGAFYSILAGIVVTIISMLILGYHIAFVPGLIAGFIVYAISLVKKQ